MLICVTSTLTRENSTEICSTIMNPLWFSWTRNLSLCLREQMSQSSFVSHWMTATIKSSKITSCQTSMYVQSRTVHLLNRHMLVHGAGCSCVKPCGAGGVWERALKMLNLRKCQKATMYMDNGGKTSGSLTKKLDPQSGSSPTGTCEELINYLF